MKLRENLHTAKPGGGDLKRFGKGKKTSQTHRCCEDVAKKLTKRGGIILTQ